MSATATHDDAPTHRVRVWDAPLRAFHWLLLAAVASAIATGLLGGAWMVWHGRAGIAIVGLIAFRLAWGLVGSETARFAQFLPSPGALQACLRGRWQGVGHNPLGALSVVALLGLLAVQVGTGLFSNDDIAFAGPFSHRLDEDFVQGLTGWHHRLVNGLYALIALHVGAIAFYAVVKRVRLVPPMVTGWQDVPRTQLAPRPARAGTFWAALLLGLSAGYAASGAWQGGAAPSDGQNIPSTQSAGPAASTAAPAW